jgi:transcriptional antiterminator
MDIRVIKKIHELIMKELTVSPKELLCELRVSERTIYNYITYMKKEMNAPIIYDNQKGNYMYERVCLLVFNG